LPHLSSPPSAATPLKRYDAAPADIAKPRSPRNAALLAALQRLQGDALLPLGPAGPDATGLTMLRAALATDAELVRAGWGVRAGPRDTGAAARAMGRLAAPQSAPTERALLSALAAYCAAALAGYPSALADDEAEAARLEAAAAAEPQQQQNAQQDADDEARERHLRLQALRALIAEKRCLAGGAAAAAAWLARLDAGAPPGEVYEELGGSSDEDGGGGGESDW
jgi:hypothetical protein